MIGYAWSGRQELGVAFSGILIQGVQVQAPLKTRTKAADELIQADTIRIADYQIDRWVESTLRKIDRIHFAREHGSWSYDDGDLCQNYNRECAYAKLCNGPREQLPLLKQTLYAKRVWNPLAEDAEDEL